ncbi:MAG: hypothetical protein ACYDAG_05455 [Chloroflexota bacterium]
MHTRLIYLSPTTGSWAPHARFSYGLDGTKILDHGLILGVKWQGDWRLVSVALVNGHSKLLMQAKVEAVGAADHERFNNHLSVVRGIQAARTVKHRICLLQMTSCVQPWLTSVSFRLATTGGL